MRALIIASIALLIGQAQDKPVDQPKAVRAVIVGMWKVDTKYGYPAKVTEWGANIDWIITFKEDGTYVWAVYEPFVEGVGRRHRDTKGTYVVNLDDNLLVLRTTELTGKRVALQSILAEDRKAFVIPSSDPKQPENKIRFIRVEPRGK